MNNSQKIIGGILAFLPLVLCAIYLFSFFHLFIEIMQAARANIDPEEVVLNEIFGLVGFAIVLGLVSLAVLVYFIIQAINNKSIDSTERLIWVLVFLFVGMVGFPIYWFARMLNGPGTNNPVQGT